MTPTDLRAARKALGMTQSALAKALRMSEKNGDRSVRAWETEGNTVPGPVQVAVEFLLNRVTLAHIHLEETDAKIFGFLWYKTISGKLHHVFF